MQWIIIWKIFVCNFWRTFSFAYFESFYFGTLYRIFRILKLPEGILHAAKLITQKLIYIYIYIYTHTHIIPTSQIYTHLITVSMSLNSNNIFRIFFVFLLITVGTGFIIVFIFPVWIQYEFSFSNKSPTCLFLRLIFIYKNQDATELWADEVDVLFCEIIMSICNLDSVYNPFIFYVKQRMPNWLNKRVWSLYCFILKKVR